jgi:thymidylate synthase (FAD)
MRFVRLDDIGMYIPQCIRENPSALVIFEQAVQFAEDSYKMLVKRMITNDMPFSKKKEITSAIRRIAPSGHATNLVVTANHRAWRHLFELRTAEGVEEEIGVVFYELSKQFKERYPNFYQDMHWECYGDYPWHTCVFENSKI